MKNNITNRQIFFLLAITLTSYSVISLPKIMAQSAGRGAWIPVAIVSVFFAFSVMVITSLNNMYQGKTLYDYSQKIVGKFFGVALSIFFMLYFLGIEVYLNFELSNVLQAEFLFKTPTWATLLIGVPVFGAIAYKGITNTARFIQIIGVVYLLTAVYTHIAMLTQGVTYNILPLFQESDIPRYIAGTKDAVFALLGIEVLTFIPFNQKNGKKATTSAFFSVILIGAFYMLVVESCIAIIGVDNIQYYRHALIEAIKIVDNPLLERFDVLYLTIGFSGLIGGISVVYLGIVEYACKIFSNVKRITVVIFTGVLIFGLSFVAMQIRAFPNIFDRIIPFVGLTASTVIPLLLLLIAKVKSCVKKKR